MMDLGFLNKVTEFTNGKVAKVVLNETYQITAFSIKQVTDNTLLMKYTVPNGAVAVINKIELKDSLDNVISSNAVYVPILSDTVIQHTIKVREV